MTLTWVDRMAVDLRGPTDAAGTVVFVHGLGGSVNAWTPLLPVLSRWHCVRPELPGSARSNRAYALGEATPHRGRLGADTLAGAVLRVFDALGIARAHLVGHSFGTLVAQHVAAREPSRVQSLALFGALAEPSPPMRDAMRARAALARERGVEGMSEIADAVSQAALSASTREAQPVAVACVREMLAAQDPEGYARNCLALAEATAAPLESLRCPVLVVGGDEDIVTPLSGARQLAERLPHARIEVLPRCGHWPMFERVAESQRALRDFLERQR